MIETGAEVPRARQCCEIPTRVLAGDTDSHHLAIEFMQRLHMLQQGAFNFVQRRRREQLAGAQIMLHFPTDPRATLRRTSYQPKNGSAQGGERVCPYVSI